MKRNMTYITCPWCGIKLPKISIRRHFKLCHNKSVEDYIAFMNGGKYPTCAAPGCNNPVKYNSKWETFNTCCHECQTKLLLYENKHHWLSDNRKDENGDDIYGKKCIENGTNPFLSKNRKLDSDGNDIMARKAYESRERSGIVNPIVFKSGSRSLDKNILTTVYILVSESNKSVKVGRSMRFESRLNTIKEFVDIDYYIKFTTDEINGAMIESEVAKKFHNYKTLDRNLVNYTEWYNISVLENIKDLITSLL